MFWLAMLVVGGYIVYVLRPDERRRVLARVVSHVSSGTTSLHVLAQRHARQREPDPFVEALKTRVRVPYLSIGVVALNVAMFLALATGSGALSDPATLVGRGGSLGPLTTNGEWWRLVTATFVHAGFVQFVIDTAALTQTAVLVERMFGRVAFAGIYLASAVLAGTIGLWADPLAVQVGASAPIFAFYGLLAAQVVRGTLRRSPITFSRRTLGRVAPVAALFVVYYMWSGGTEWRAGLATFVIGFAIGLPLTRGAAECTPGPLRVLPLAATTLSIAIAIVTPLKGMTDVRADITRLFATEDHVAARYHVATEQFTRGAIKAEVLAQLIERSIVPELESARRRLHAIGGVPKQQQALVAGADEYLRLRGESWKLRADALHKANMRLLRDADQKDRASAVLLDKIRPALGDSAGS